MWKYIVLCLVVNYVSAMDEAVVTDAVRLTRLTQIKALFPDQSENKTGLPDDMFSWLTAKVDEFVSAHSKPEDTKTWDKKFAQRTETRAKDTDKSDNEAANDLVISWLTPRRFNTSWSVEEALELSRLFVFYLGKKWTLPERVQAYITSDEGRKSLEGMFK